MAYVHIDDKYEPYFNIIMDCIKLKGQDIDEQIQKIISDTNTMGECLEDNFLEFKLHSKKVRDEYQKAVDQEIEKTEAVWRKCDELINNSRPDLEQAAKGMTDLIYIVDKLNKKIDDVSLWKVEKILELVEKFNKMPETEKQILIKLIQIEGKKDE